MSKKKYRSPQLQQYSLTKETYSTSGGSGIVPQPPED